MKLAVTVTLSDHAKVLYFFMQFQLRLLMLWFDFKGVRDSCEADVGVSTGVVLKMHTDALSVLSVYEAHCWLVTYSKYSQP